MTDATTDTDEALLVRVAAVSPQEIGVVEDLSAELARVVFVLGVLLKLFGSVESVLVGKNLLVRAAEVAHGGVVFLAGVALEVVPAETLCVAGRVGTVEPE